MAIHSELKMELEKHLFEISNTVITQYIVALSFPTLVFLMRLSFKSDYLSRATIFKKSRVKTYFQSSILEAMGIDEYGQRKELTMFFLKNTLKLCMQVIRNRL